MNEMGRDEVWERLDTLDDAELETLIAAASAVMADRADTPAAREALTMAPGPTARELRFELQGAGVEIDAEDAERLVSDEGASREAAIAALRELGKEPVLAEEIEEAWQARRGLMVIDAGLVSAGALLLLVMKLKRVKVGKGQAEVDFYEVKDGVLGALRRFLQG